MKKLATVSLLFISSLIYAETTMTGYIESYYSTRQEPYLYSFNRKDHLAVNHALILVNHTNKNYRASLGLQAGTYVEDNYAAEPNYFHPIFQASAGAKLMQNVWVDAGIMPSHIGFESAIGKDNWNLSRSVMADNSPYFETGAKVTYDPGTNWSAAIMVLNGWQTIADTGARAVGTQITYKPNDSVVINYSTYLENRQFHDFYVQLQVNPQWSLAGLFDLGIQSKKTWYGWAVLNKYKVNDNWTIGGRIESYQDPDHIIIAGDSQINGLSANVDYAINKNILLRVEERYLDKAATQWTTSTSLSIGF